MDKQPKTVKPVFSNLLYSVIRKGGSWAVVLSSNFDKVQFSGARDYCVSWATENGSLETA